MSVRPRSVDGEQPLLGREPQQLPGDDSGEIGARLVGLELVRVSVPLREEWASAAGTFSQRDSLLVRAVLSAPSPGGGLQESEGWGECGALPDPTYSSEYTAAAAEVACNYLVPALLRAGVASAEAVGPALWGTKGHQMAKAAFEAALLDAQLRAGGQRMADFLAAKSKLGEPASASVVAGVAVGLAEHVGTVLEEVERHIAAGYHRVKLKITPEHDVEVLSAVRDRWPELVLFADANGSYRHLGFADVVALLSRLDGLGLTCLEQPLGESDLVGHARLARWLGTPICLDETLTSLDTVATALELGACSVVNIKASRLGGYLAAVEAHDLCASRDVPVWCGGMVETGIARAANVALAALPRFSLPGDLSATGRYFEADLASPLPLRSDGTIAVPDGPGTGVEVDNAAVSNLCTWRRWWPARYGASR